MPARLQRLACQMHQYNVAFHYRKSKSMHLSNCLSRNTEYEKNVFYLWYPKVTLHLVINMFSLPQVAHVAIGVAYNDLPLYLYTKVVQNTNIYIYSHKKDSQVISMRFF